MFIVDNFAIGETKRANENRWLYTVGPQRRTRYPFETLDVPGTPYTLHWFLQSKVVSDSAESGEMIPEFKYVPISTGATALPVGAAPYVPTVQISHTKSEWRQVPQEPFLADAKVLVPSLSKYLNQQLSIFDLRTIVQSLPLKLPLITHNETMCEIQFLERQVQGIAVPYQCRYKRKESPVQLENVVTKRPRFGKVDSVALTRRLLEDLSNGASLALDTVLQSYGVKRKVIQVVLEVLLTVGTIVVENGFISWSKKSDFFPSSSNTSFFSYFDKDSALSGKSSELNYPQHCQEILLQQEGTQHWQQHGQEKQDQLEINKQVQELQSLHEIHIWVQGETQQLQPPPRPQPQPQICPSITKPTLQSSINSNVSNPSLNLVITSPNVLYASPAITSNSTNSNINNNININNNSNSNSNNPITSTSTITCTSTNTNASTSIGTSITSANSTSTTSIGISSTNSTSTTSTTSSTTTSTSLNTSTGTNTTSTTSTSTPITQTESSTAINVTFSSSTPVTTPTTTNSITINTHSIISTTPTYPAAIIPIPIPIHVPTPIPIPSPTITTSIPTSLTTSIPANSTNFGLNYNQLLPESSYTSYLKNLTSYPPGLHQNNLFNTSLLASMKQSHPHLIGSRVPLYPSSPPPPPPPPPPSTTLPPSPTRRQTAIFTNTSTQSYLPILHTLPPPSPQKSEGRSFSLSSLNLLSKSSTISIPTPVDLPTLSPSPLSFHQLLPPSS
eukprot:TRINITY_DN1492_c0_g1_i2.p1 TRINITY_DN1492_c0_g1~~TRINITY_DN1492_c0_g1_i2.p1  ORF type:complete len:731 (-),score=147.18 TRINITY_DN1492_c0_g1_i2:198-2390(-)